MFSVAQQQTTNTYDIHIFEDKLHFSGLDAGPHKERKTTMDDKYLTLLSAQVSALNRIAVTATFTTVR